MEETLYFVVKRHGFTENLSLNVYTLTSMTPVNISNVKPTTTA
jgi:hypothetical protein